MIGVVVRAEDDGDELYGIEVTSSVYVSVDDLRKLG